MGTFLRPECVGLYLTRFRARVAIDVNPLEPPLADQIARLLQQRFVSKVTWYPRTATRYLSECHLLRNVGFTMWLPPGGVA